ncbi:MAG: DUF7662 domain-containing protein [Candidatus Bathycorpusculaceae bacterium]
MPIKDECGICGRVLSLRYLRRCQRCGRLYCLDCMVPDVATGDPMRMLCLNCARKVVSPISVSKYDRLRSYLKFRAAFTDMVRLSFAKIDGIIGDNLPINAYRSEAWWNNSSSNAHSRTWLEAGWETQEVNLKEGYVIFRKVKSTIEPKRKKTSHKEIKKPFTPVPARFPKPRKPSKTKVSKLYARIKNLERQRTSMPQYRGSFKPKPRHERELFKTDKKP